LPIVLFEEFSAGAAGEYSGAEDTNSRKRRQ
jgi:hypothetical protein